MSNDQRNPVEQAVELLVYAPIGVALFAKDTIPSFLKLFVARGQAELEAKRKRVTEQANQYKVVGQFAVRYGGPEVRRQAEERLGGVKRRAEETFDTVVSAIPTQPAAPTGAITETREPAAAPTVAPAPPAPAPAAAGANGNGNGSTPTAPTVTSLAIPDYDELSASQVVERLDGLAAVELDAVAAYEGAHRGRRTILGKIEQLRA